MLRRDVYSDVGGHGAVRAEVVDDIALGTLVKRSGYSFRVFLGHQIAAVRMYTGVRSLLFGMVKNLSFVAGGESGHPVLAPLSTLALAVAASLPPALLAWQLVTGGNPVGPALAYTVPIALTLPMRPMARFNVLRVTLYPLTPWVLFLATVIASYYRLSRGTVMWRGREVEL
jgi:4,4'-diaponeurosporenoate glycosyltransferase